MNALRGLILLCVLLAACARDIAGFSREERLTGYGTALLLAGKPELAAVAYGLRRPVTSAKQPRPLTVRVSEGETVGGWFSPLINLFQR